MNFKTKHLFTFFIIIFCTPLIDSNALLGQSDITQTTTRSGQGRYQDDPYFARKKYAIKCAKELKEGTLIVRLISFQNKIDHLNKIGKTEKANKEQARVDNINNYFYTEFTKDYDFSDVVFCYGAGLKEFLSGENDKIFLNENLEIDESIKLKEGPIFLLASQGNDSYYLYDSDFNPIPEPAPTAINNGEKKNKTFSLDRLFENFSKTRSTSESVYYFNAKLEKLLIE